MKKLINFSVTLLLLSVMACSKHFDPAIELNMVPIYRIEFKQDENYEMVDRQLIFEEGMLLKGYNGKVVFTNEDLSNPGYIFETEGAPSNLHLILRIESTGSSNSTQFSFKIFKNGKHVMNVTHLASGNATKEYRISI
jgi:hypothetical protein